MNLENLTLEQIKKLDAELDAKQKERHRKIQEEIELIKKEAEEIRKETDAIKKEAEEIRKETDAIKKRGEEEHLKRLAEIDAIRKEGDEISKKNDIEINRLLKITSNTNLKLNGLDTNIGYGVEEIFYESINKTKQIGNTVYDECTQNVHIFKKLHNTKNAIDILLVNGKEIAIIEVKHRIGLNAVEQLIKTANLYKNNNDITNYTLNLYVAGLSLHPSARQALKDNKIGFIKIRGEHFDLVDNLN